MTRQSYQQGYVSKPIPTRSGTVFKIRYRVKSADGKWNHKSETLYGLAGKKAARAALDERIREVSTQKRNAKLQSLWNGQSMAICSQLFPRSRTGTTLRQ